MTGVLFLAISPLLILGSWKLHKSEGSVIPFLVVVALTVLAFVDASGELSAMMPTLEGLGK